ncbi:MAG TPA: hypothetical protein VHN11_16555 [Xanthobacteraceae bacterium]|nr:hypothetical protein [Xanthobacteraceae bacterium]
MVNELIAPVYAALVALVDECEGIEADIALVEREMVVVQRRHDLIRELLALDGIDQPPIELGALRKGKGR